MFFEVNGGPNSDWFRTDELNAVKFYGRGFPDQYWLDALSTQDRFFGGAGNDLFYFTNSQFVGAFTQVSPATLSGSQADPVRIRWSTSLPLIYGSIPTPCLISQISAASYAAWKTLTTQ